MPQLESLGMEPTERRCGIVASMAPARGQGSAWMAGVGSDCLVTVLDLAVLEAADLTSVSGGYFCLGAMSRSSLDTMPEPSLGESPSGIIAYHQSPGTYPYRLRPRTPYRSRSLCFTPRFLKQLAWEGQGAPDDLFARLNATPELPMAPQLATMLNRLDGAQADGRATGLHLTALAAEAAAYLIEAAESSAAADLAQGTRKAAALVADARSLMEQNLGEMLTLEGIARELCVSRAHLAATYKAETGYGVAEDLRKLRMARAAELVSGTDLPLAEVGHRVGYPRQSSFTEAFKRHHGCSPAQYRKSAR